MKIDKIQQMGTDTIWANYTDDAGRDCLARIGFLNGQMVIDTDLPVLVRLAGDFQLTEANKEK